MVATVGVPVPSFEAADAVAKHQPNAAVSVRPGDRLAHVLVKAAEHIAPAAHDGDVASQRGKQTGKLHRDVSGAADDKLSRESLQVEDAVRSDTELDAVEGRQFGPCACRDQYRARAYAAAVFEEAHRMRVLEHSARSHDLDARAFLTGTVEPFQACDFAVLRGDQ